LTPTENTCSLVPTTLRSGHAEWHRIVSCNHVVFFHTGYARLRHAQRNNKKLTSLKTHSNTTKIASLKTAAKLFTNLYCTSVRNGQLWTCGGEKSTADCLITYCSRPNLKTAFHKTLH